MPTIQQKRGVASNWSAQNPVLAAGEIGYETDTGKFKIGDGTSDWSSLSYFSTSGGGGSGTVTSVDMTVPTGLSITGNPITTSGTLAISLASGYSIPTTASQTNWDTAYGWGNHSSAGYALLTATQTFTGTNTFTNAATNAKALVINNISGTSVNLFEVQANSSAYLYLTSGGSLYNSGRLLVRADYSATFNVGIGSSTQVGAIIRGAASQTADLQQWQSSAGSSLAKVDSAGNVTAASFVKTSGTSSQILLADGTTLATSTYVTSVTGTSPVSSSGGTTPAISLASNYGDTQNPYGSKTANYFLASPNGTSGTPSFRAIVAADLCGRYSQAVVS